MEKCNNEGNVLADENTVFPHGAVLGGLAGHTYNATISTSKNSGSVYYNITRQSDNGGGIGGLVGLFLNSKVEQCFNSGSVWSGSGSAFGQENCGGGFGYVENVDVINFYNTGSVKGSVYVGGLVGVAGANAERSYFYNCYNSSSSIKANGDVGDLFGTAGKVNGDYLIWRNTLDPVGVDDGNNNWGSDCYELTVNDMKKLSSGLLDVLKRGEGSGLWGQNEGELPYLVNNR